MGGAKYHDSAGDDQEQVGRTRTGRKEAMTSLLCLAWRVEGQHAAVFYEQDFARERLI